MFKSKTKALLEAYSRERSDIFHDLFPSVQALIDSHRTLILELKLLREQEGKEWEDARQAGQNFGLQSVARDTVSINDLMNWLESQLEKQVPVKPTPPPSRMLTNGKSLTG